MKTYRRPLLVALLLVGLGLSAWWFFRPTSTEVSIAPPATELQAGLIHMTAAQNQQAAAAGKLPEFPTEKEGEVAPAAFGQSVNPADTQFAVGAPDDPMAAEKWFWGQRVYPSDQIPFEVHNQAIEMELQSAQALEAEAGPSWTNLGPAPLRDITYGGTSAQHASGRALSVAVHPTNSNIVLIGAAQGGIWRSTDAGATYQGVADKMPSLAVKVIRFAPSNPQIIYAGTGEPHGSTSIYGQGVLKSSDGGATWAALPASGSGWDFRYTSVSGLQVHPTDPNTVYVTTAAVATSVDHFNPKALPATGIYKSTNGGTSWTLLKAATLRDHLFPFYYGSGGFMDLELAKSNPNLLYATEYLGGIYRSQDGGATWTILTPFHASGNAIFPAVVDSYNYYYGGDNSNPAGFYHFTRCNRADLYPEFDRIELGLSQSNPNVLYAGYSAYMFLDMDGNSVCGNNEFASAGLLFKSSDGGATWTWLGDWPNGVPDYCASQCSYDNTVEVNPANPNDVLIGGSANYNYLWPEPLAAPTRFNAMPWRGMVHRSLDGGQNFFDITPHCTSIGSASVGQAYGLPVYQCAGVDARKVIHPDVHGIAYDPSNANRLFVANDGGIYRAAVDGNGAAPENYTWDNLNQGLSTLQFYFFDVHPTNPNIMIGGLQDNSVAYWDGTKWEGWGFGDGTFGAIDPKDPKYVYMGTQFNIHRHDAGGAKVALTPDGNPANGWNLAIQQMASGDSAQFITPFEIDPVQTNNIYFASQGAIYRSTNRGAPGSWSRAFTTLETATTISVSPVNNRYVWVGNGVGNVYLYDTTTSNYDTVGWDLPGRYVSKVEASPVDANTVYVTLSGYSANTQSNPGHVFKSTNLGQTWTNISGNLPDVPVSAFAIDPKNVNRMWVGSDVGVFMTKDGGATWSSYRINMPVVAIMDMKYNATTKFLSVVTHGRGAWRINPDYVAPVYPERAKLPFLAVRFDGKAPAPQPTKTPGPSPTPKPSATPTATATQQGQATATPTDTPTPTATATQQAAQLPVFLNYNFELGDNGDWSSFSYQGYNNIVNSGFPTGLTPYSGSWLAWIGGPNELAWVDQTVEIPENTGPLHLWFRFQIRSDDTNCSTSAPDDYFEVNVSLTQIGGIILCNTNNTSNWVLGYIENAIPNAAYMQYPSVQFYVWTNDDAENSHIFIEDVEFHDTLPTMNLNPVKLENLSLPQAPEKQPVTAPVQSQPR